MLSLLKKTPKDDFLVRSEEIATYVDFSINNYYLASDVKKEINFLTIEYKTISKRLKKAFNQNEIFRLNNAINTLYELLYFIKNESPLLEKSILKRENFISQIINEVNKMKKDIK